MNDPYIGEVRMFAGNYVPVGWAACDGQLLAISDNESLYTLIGTTYGGNGVNNFALPDLCGRIPIRTAPNYPLGMQCGEEMVTLLAQQLPVHSHFAQVYPNFVNSTTPSGQFWSANAEKNFSNDVTQLLVQMSTNAVTPAGGGQPHDNIMPSLTVTFIIALYGIYPSQG